MTTSSSLGGHSLLATQVISRVRDAFGQEVALRSLFEQPTVAGLVQSIEQAQRAGSGLLAPPLVRVTGAERLPLSFAQQRLWFLDQLEPGSRPTTYRQQCGCVGRSMWKRWSGRCRKWCAVMKCCGRTSHR